MSAQETITKLIEKYEAKLKVSKDLLESSYNETDSALFYSKVSAYKDFISDLKQLQQIP